MFPAYAEDPQRFIIERDAGFFQLMADYSQVFLLGGLGVVQNQAEPV